MADDSTERIMADQDTERTAPDQSAERSYFLTAESILYRGASISLATCSGYCPSQLTKRILSPCQELHTQATLLRGRPGRQGAGPQEQNEGRQTKHRELRGVRLALVKLVTPQFATLRAPGALECMNQGVVWPRSASPASPYNELAVKKPEVLHTLTDLWVLDTFKPISIQPPRHVRPLQLVDSDKNIHAVPFLCYPVTGFQRERNPSVPPPLAIQPRYLS
ncbi:hypothetical protein B0H67DRAFT_236687 [Lasiosphaeris hirsuta]|uniref:Uncharacterized protein n=1 Tax=Lasiosphaeris hirsuta TaxID=260670 RepID=A0AA40AG42_9PEZI|nr:hypothetical protein B0H67DRAFT_236687 [Lasiosphaeris hirsuta]